ncbi:MAG: hypothetical protein FJY85_23130, partial [Deltaproteobacteria bacterium]|nr:hypothetical protein [Deltaproteobacteria bacterium]
MTHKTEDTDFVGLGQVEPLQIKLPGGLWLEMADSWTNRRGLMIFLRCLRRPDGRSLMTYEAIASALGYADRRNVNNFWREFEGCGEDLEAYLSRRKKVDGEVVALCEAIWKAHPLWSAVEVHAELVKQFPQQALGLSEANVRTAGHQIGFLGIQQALRRQVREGQVAYKEPVFMEALFALADAGAKAQAEGAGTVDLLPEALEAVRAQGVEPEEEADVEGTTAEALEGSLLKGEASPGALKRLWEGTTGRGMLAFVLYYHGLSLEVIGSFFGVHKTTVMRWLEP